MTVNSGTLNLQNGGTNNSTISVATAATLKLSLFAFVDFQGPGPYAFYPTFTFASGSELNDSGNLLFGGSEPFYIYGVFTPYYGIGTNTVDLAGTGFVAGTSTFNDNPAYETSRLSTLRAIIISPNAVVISGGTVNFNGTNTVTPLVVTMSSGT